MKKTVKDEIIKNTIIDIKKMNNNVNAPLPSTPPPFTPVKIKIEINEIINVLIALINKPLIKNFDNLLFFK